LLSYCHNIDVLFAPQCIRCGLSVVIFPIVFEEPFDISVILASVRASYVTEATITLLQLHPHYLICTHSLRLLQFVSC
jgi:hypothetical protein